jgi:hypothetical protein
VIYSLYGIVKSGWIRANVAEASDPHTIFVGTPLGKLKLILGK